MQLINKIRRCSNCGCISFPDSKSCPKCGNIFNKSMDQQVDILNSKLYLYNKEVENNIPDSDYLVINLSSLITVTKVRHSIYQIT